MKLKKIILLGLLIITTAFVSAQDCWDRRYLENPNVVTIYKCNMLHLKNPKKDLTYDISILVDSITPHQKILKLYAHFNTFHEYPMFEAELTNGKVIPIYSDYHTDEYMEAWLTDEQVEMFKNKEIKKISIWHDYLSDNPNPMLVCNDFFSEFLVKH